MSSHLSSGKINLAILRELYRRELVELLDSCTGKKCILWDDELIGPISLIADFTFLKEHNVVKMHPLAMNTMLPDNIVNFIFILRPDANLLNIVASILSPYKTSRDHGKLFHIYFVPRKNLLGEKKLKDLGVYSCFESISEFRMDLIPYDYDILSMNFINTFKDCSLHKDETSLFHIAQSLMTLQSLFGVIPQLHSKGYLSKKVIKMMMQMKKTLNKSSNHITPKIDQLLIMDREVDLITPFMSPLTFEALIDDVYGINNTIVKLPGEKFAKETKEISDQPVPPKKMYLNSADELYIDLRDKHVNAIGGALSRTTKSISAQFEERHQAKNIQEIKKFVNKFPHINNLRTSTANFTSIAELIKDVTSTDEFIESIHAQHDFINGTETDKPHPFIEDCIGRQDDLLKVLQLVCLQCQCNNGFKDKLLDYYRREIIQTYGYENIITLNNLEETGLLKTQGQKNFASIRKQLRIITDDVNEITPTDISYTFSGYAPISVRLAQALVQPSGWSSPQIVDLMNTMPGPVVNETQPTYNDARRGSISSLQSNLTQDNHRVTLVFYIGGITHSELAAYRFLSHQEDSQMEYVIATTSLINANTFLNTLTE